MIAASKPRKPSSPLRPRKVKSTGPEWLLQAAMVAEFHKLEAEGYRLTVAADMGAARRSFAEAAKCKAMGLTAGEPDVRVYCQPYCGAPGVLISIECKVDEKQPSDVQIARHDKLRALGFRVYVENLTTEIHARAIARRVAYLNAERVAPPANDNAKPAAETLTNQVLS